MSFVPLAAAWVVAAAVPTPEPFPRGEIVERVQCLADPGLSYALYLPNAVERPAPVLYVLDARGRGAHAAACFAAGAEKYGWIVASSNDSMSDGPWEPNVTAMQAMWRDTRSRFAVDPRRAYASGFSGGARAAALLADAAPGSLAGVIAVGAGFAAERPPHAGLGFAVYGIVGATDFNYREMRELRDALEGLRLPHRLAVFEGGHHWPPPEECAAAVAWMELRAMRDGQREREPALVAAWLEEGLGEARREESNGLLLEAEARLRSLARDFAGLADVASVEAALALLAASKELQKARKADAKHARREADHEWRARRALASASADPMTLPLLLSELRVAELQRKARGASEPEERRSVARMLEKLLVQTSFYLPRDLMQRGEHARAALLLSVAAEIRPEHPFVWYRLAQARAQLGQEGAALEALERAAAAGFRDAARLEAQPELAPLRDEVRFRRLLDSLRGEAAAAPH